jgi:hypothetical protein
MTAKPSFKLPLPLWDGVERPIEVPFKESPPRFASRVPSTFTAEEWEHHLFCLALPTRWQPEHLFANVGGASGNCLTMRTKEPFSTINHDLRRLYADLHAAYDWFAGIGPEPMVFTRPMLPVVPNPFLLVPSNRRLPSVKERESSKWPLSRKEHVPVQIAIDRVCALFLGVDPDRFTRESQMRRALEERARRGELGYGPEAAE